MIVTTPIGEIRQLLTTLFESKKAKFGSKQGVRTIQKGATGKKIYFFYSVKNKIHIQCESELERDHCIRLEFDSNVKQYLSQPFCLELSGNSRYTPDFAILTTNEEYIVQEVKFSGSLQNQKLNTRLEKIRMLFESQNIQFKTFSEKEIQTHPNLYNSKLLYRAGSIKFPDDEVESAIKILKQQPQRYSLEQLRKACKKSKLHPLLADFLIFKGLASYNQKQLINNETILTSMGASHD